MFDIGFSELLLFGVIALIVLGPEKLPQAARTAGQWYAKIRRTVTTLQSEIEAELDLAETRQQMQKELAKIRETEAEMRREMAEMRGSLQEFESSQNQHLKAAHQVNTAKVDSASNKIDHEKDDHSSVAPKEFDYAYDRYDSDKKLTAPEPLELQNSNNDANLKTDVNDNTHQIIQTAITKPWENMWFRLGAYDKARRLPQPPYLPNYKADTLLNNHLNKPSINKSSIQQASAKQQEND